MHPNLSADAIVAKPAAQSPNASVTCITSPGRIPRAIKLLAPSSADLSRSLLDNRRATGLPVDPDVMYILASLDLGTIHRP